MSEYQYYEFQAVDRPLTPQEMAELRALASRATITATSLQNVYHFGDFRGDPQALMEKYFDAFVYVANWGTHQFMLRLPRRLFDPALADRYSVGEAITVWDKGENVVLEFRVDDEERSGWVDDEESQAWLPALLPVRAELAGGDLRALYLGWLLDAQFEVFEHETVEPPVPPGLGNLSASLQTLADFLGVDQDLIAAAAERSARLEETAPAAEEMARWVRDLPAAEKDALLLRVLAGNDPHLHTELSLRFKQETMAASRPLEKVAESRRTVRDLLVAARIHAEARKRAEAEEAARERARQQREAAAARAKHLASLAGRESELWYQVVDLLEARRGKEYEQAVQLLVDLRELAARSGEAAPFAARFGQLRERYGKSAALQKRFQQAGL